MQLSAALLGCLFILCLGRTIDTPLKHLKLDTGRVAAFSLLMLAMSALEPITLGELSLNAGAVLMLAIMARHVRKRGESISRAMVYSIPASLTMFAAGLAGFETFAPLAILPFALPLGCAGALFMAALSPILICIYSAALDLYLYGYAVLGLGDANTLNLQVAGLYAAAAASLIMLYGKERLKAGGL